MLGPSSFLPALPRVFGIALVIFLSSHRPFLCQVACCSAGSTALPSSPSSTLSSPLRHPNPDPSIDWDSFTFSLNNVRTDYMWHDNIRVQHDEGDPSAVVPSYSSSSTESLAKLGPIPLHPTSTVLSYGQSLFEGLKAFRRSDGSIALFRPTRNAERMIDGANRLLLPPVPVDTFVTAVDAVVRANARWVPPFGKGSLYVRPLLFGSGEGLGVGPSSECSFCIYCSPVGNYFKGGLKPIRLQAVRGYSWAAPGGSGSIKAGGNYAPAFLVQREVRRRGYDEALFLDAVSGEAVEEAGASNFFAVFPNNTVITPHLTSETILPGVTRASIMELLRRECDCVVLESRLTLSDLRGACEAFCCGTGASLTPVGCVNVVSRHVAGEDASKDNEREDITFGDGKTAGPLTEFLYKILVDVQMGTQEDLNEKYGEWVHIVHPRPDLEEEEKEKDEQ